MRPHPTPVRRLLVGGAAAIALVATAVSIPSYGDREGSLVRHYDAAKAAAAEERPRAGEPGDEHNHNDPSTKNAVSRAGEVSEATKDPTTAAERIANAAHVAAERQRPDPALTTTRIAPPRPKNPTTRYAMANGCYAMVIGRRWVQRENGGLALTARTRGGAQPFYFKPTELGTYLLYGKRRDFLAGGDDVTMAPEPSTDTEWTVAKAGKRFTLRLGKDRFLAVGEGGALVVAAKGTRFRISKVPGCSRYPESQINIKGAPFSGETDIQEVRGYVDAHTHGMAFEFLGGAHCGKPWDKYGAPYALVDCPDHETGVNPLESFLSGNPNHDPVGWPTFKDWPAPESLTHEGTYYKWMERSWRGGQRLFVNLLVENNQLCRLYPYKRDGLSDATCDEMESVERQAKDMYLFQDYIDAQFGGPGRGFYRIVKSPFEAREVINSGRMAVIMGIETSVPFGCTFKVVAGEDVPACSEESIDEQLAMVHKWGVRQMELVNKFDNALSGITGDGGETGAVVNNANFAETGTYWDMEHCEPEHPDAHDKNQYAAPEIDAEQQDALFGAIGALSPGQQIGPIYPPPDHCNTRGLTDLGAHLVDRLVERGMLIDPDHMSVKARNTLLDQVEARGYSGIMSSHSWSTEDAYPRIYEMGGYIAPYAGDSTGFVGKWRKHLEWADDRYYFGFGYGADINGLGAQGDPRGADVPNPVTYPFTGLGGVTVDKQHAGERVYDINVDGVAQYGLYPDWIEDVRTIADTQEGDGDAIVEDMARGAEAYLQTWERAVGIAPDSCRNPGLRKSVDKVRDLVDNGMTTRQVMKAVGQPFQRLGNRFTICATEAGDPEVKMVVTFSDRGRVTGLTRKG